MLDSKNSLRSLLLVFCFASIAHAVPAQAQSSPRLAVGLPGFSTAILLDSVASVYTVAAPRKAVFGAAVQALQELDVPIEAVDANRGIIVTTSIVRMHRLGKMRLTQIMSCGTNITGLIADQFRLTMAVAVIADSVGPTETKLRLALAGGAESVDGASKPSVMCSTTGVLEERLAKLIEAKSKS